MTKFAIPELAAFAVSMRDRQLPNDIVPLAQTILADAIGCAVFGKRFDWSRFARNVTGVVDENTRAPLALSPGGMRSDAFLWGLQAHAFELDSLRSPGAGVHPGATVALPALAAARATDASGAVMIRAIIAGIEVMFRIGNATLHTPEQRGFHAPGFTGPFGSATAVGFLLGLNEAQMANALGIAASLSGGLLAFNHSQRGGMVKPLHMGRAAESGVLAALLAAEGYEGPETALEGRFGLMEAACNASDPSMLLAGLGTDWEIRRTCFKIFAAHITAHPPVYALKNWMKRDGIVPDQIAAIEVGASAKVLSHHVNKNPTNITGAQYSVPFMLATAAVRGLDDPRCVTADLLEDTTVAALCERITVIRSDVKGWNADLGIRLADGRQIVLPACGFPGMPEAGLHQEVVLGKLEMLLRDEPIDLKASIARLMQLGEIPRVAMSFGNLFSD